MDGLKWKTLFLMDDLGVPQIFGNTNLKKKYLED